MTADDWIAHLRLAPHPEGGYFRRGYTAELTLDLPDRTGPRPVATAIFYLLKGDQHSRLHRLKSDELWHFHLGSALTLHRLGRREGYVATKLGANPAAGQHLQIAVRAGCWFGATVDDPAGFSLLGCTVAPGFDFADFELANRATLIHQYPQHAALIERLT
ncbi:MAG: cupin domain-containing protein [Candidatus Competibacter sp.]|jgi:predicted cupin superfamily sugar epimerase|nr:cupin domain-containing protein [Candidatus Competibacter sp.]